MHAATTLGRAGATPLSSASSRPQFCGVAPGVTGLLQAGVVAACIQSRKQREYTASYIPTTERSES